MSNKTGCRADVSSVESIRSKAFSRPTTADEDEEFTRILPHQTERMGKTTALLQDVEWEVYEGTYGPHTLLKEVKHETMACPDCEAKGVYDERGDIVCSNECGRILNDSPLMLPEDHFNGRTEGAPSGNGKQALRDAKASHSEEPTVQ